MLHAHYMSSQVRRTGTARCVYAVYITKEQRDELFRNAPIQNNRVVLGHYDDVRREVCMRRASAAESGPSNHSHGAFTLGEVKANPERFGKVAGMWMVQITSNNVRSGGLPFAMPFLFAMREAASRIVNVKGVPHLVWQLPTRDQVEAPRMRRENKEALYNPTENPSSDVRFVTVKSYQAEQAQLPQVSQTIAADRHSPIGRGPGAKPQELPPATPFQQKGMGNGVGSAGRSADLPPVQRLKMKIAAVNALAAQIGGVEFAVIAGKVRASVVTKIDL